MLKNNILISFAFLSFCIYPLHAAEILTWKQCVQETLAHNPDMKQSKENLLKARANKRSTVSFLYPQISGSVRETTSKTEDSEKSTGYSYGVSGSQLLFDGFKSIYQVAEANKNLESAQMQYEEASSGVRLRLRRAFISLLKAYKLIKLTKSIARRRTKSLRLVRLRYEAGREHKGAYLTAVANDRQARFEVEQAKRNIKIAARRLVKELGRDNVSMVNVKGKLLLDAKYEKKPDKDKLILNNPSLRKSAANKEASLYSLKSTRADLLPAISASGSASKSDSEWQPETYQWSAGVSLSLPLFQGGRNMAAIAYANAAYEQSRAQEESARLEIMLSLEETWNNLLDAKGHTWVQKKFLDAAYERAKIAEAQYSTGLLSFDNWIIIEDDLIRTKKTYLNAQADALIAEAEWLGAQGKTLEEEIQ